MWARSKSDDATASRCTVVWAARIAAALVLATVACLAAAAVAYPGGSWADARATHFALAENYWCDLMRVRAVNGAANDTARAFARCAFLSLGAGLAAFWPAVVTLVRGQRTRHACRVAGVASSLGVMALAVVPFDRAPVLHAIVTLTAGGFGSVALAAAVVGSWRAGRLRGAPRVGATLMVAAVLANIVVYVDCSFVRPGPSAALPVVQKLATLLLVAWLLATARAIIASAAVPTRA